jgi:hypothetical protein
MVVSSSSSKSVQSSATIASVRCAMTIGTPTREQLPHVHARVREKPVHLLHRRLRVQAPRLRERTADCRYAQGCCVDDAHRRVGQRQHPLGVHVVAHSPFDELSDGLEAQRVLSHPPIEHACHIAFNRRAAPSISSRNRRDQHGSSEMRGSLRSRPRCLGGYLSVLERNSVARVRAKNRVMRELLAAAPSPPSARCSRGRLPGALRV